jgi:hypothetical protein
LAVGIEVDDCTLMAAALARAGSVLIPGAGAVVGGVYVGAGPVVAEITAGE